MKTLTSQQVASVFQFDILPVAEWDGIPKDRIRTTQLFGKNKLNYSQFGLKGHNGIDIGYPDGTRVIAPCEMYIKRFRTANKDKGYGNVIYAETKEIKIDDVIFKLELVFAHLKEFSIPVNEWVTAGTTVALGDSTGFSTGPHLHFGVRPHYKTIWGFKTDSHNGYKGYIDPEPLLPRKIHWTVGELRDLHNIDARVDDFIKEHDTKLVRDNNTGEVAWLYAGKLRTANTFDKKVELLLNYLVRREGAVISDKEFWRAFPKKPL